MDHLETTTLRSWGGGLVEKDYLSRKSSLNKHRTWVVNLLATICEQLYGVIHTVKYFFFSSP